MPVIVVANPKGGVGKSTISTNIAGYYASRGHAVMLGDVDVQQSSKLWLQLRPPQARPIQSWDIDADNIAKPPKGVTHVVLDTPAGLHGKRLREVLKRADRIVVPLQASVFDVFATRAFLDELAASRKADDVPVALVGMRVHANTLSADKLRAMADQLGWPLLTMLRDTQNYVHLAASGLTLFDVAKGKVERDLEQWGPLVAWLGE
ncbi:MAG: ParA family protein [Rhodoferax sp.]|nr:MAG: ParA family protein [Rhodoferax sp.]